MSFAQRIRTSAALLVIAFLLAACGTGISVDPAAFDRPGTNDADGDGSSTETDDASPPDGVTGSGGDASIGQDGVSSDRRADASEWLDGASENRPTDDDARDGSDDGAVDGHADRSADSVDSSTDIEIDRDASLDLGNDRSIDAGIERDAAGADSDAGGVPSDSSDAPQDTGRDVFPTDTIDGCTVGCGHSALNYYVDASAPPGGDGSPEAPFRTISAAVAAHVKAPGQARTAYVTAGTYDEALGETFPLVLRGLSLQGAGADKTFIVGSGMFDHAGQGGPKNQQYMVTMVVGDRFLPTKVARLSIRPLSPVPARGYYGVFCDRGNATGEVASPAGQTHLDEVTIGAGFDTSLLVLPSTLPVPVTGCNMLMTRSTVTGGWTGVFAVGCDGSDAPVPVLLEMGTDDPSSGNAVTWMQGQSGMGNGVVVNNCVARASFQYNTIADCSTGINLGGSGPSPGSRPFLIKHNTFARMSNIGLYDWGSAIFVEEISDNRFLDTTRAASSFERAVGLRIEQANVGKVRRNSFAGNDVGLRLDAGTEQTDLGRPGDPGENVFYCNSGIDGWLGADVVVSYPPMSPPTSRPSRGANGFRGSFVRDADGGDDAGSPALLPFAGNAWDQAAPRALSLDFAPNGVEIGLDWAPPLVFDLSGSSLVTTPCPQGRIP
jgi:Protein of unknown function (DUF1565)